MKFHELKPFILEAVYALFLYIACPLFMLLNGWIEIQIADFVGFILIIIWSACFLKAIAFEIVPGLYALLDLTLNNFRKERMVYLDGYDCYMIDCPRNDFDAQQMGLQVFSLIAPDSDFQYWQDLPLGVYVYHGAGQRER